MAADWRTALLQRLGAPATTKNLAFLANWQRWEGGHTNNAATYNWLNTTRKAPGAVGSINSVGVKAFDSFDRGVDATAATLMSGRYNDIVNGLRKGDPYAAKPVSGLSTWVSGSSTGNIAYAGKVLGDGSLKGRAAQAFKAGPAGVVNGPSPAQFAQFQQQRVMSLLQMSANAVSGNFSQNFQALQALGQAREALASASSELANAENSARSYGGSATPLGPAAYAGSSGQLRTILQAADAQIGKPYVWGAESPGEGGFDCSGLIDWAFKQAGIDLPGRLTTQTAIRMGVSVKGKPLKPGDWLITNRGKHMVMYVGNGQVIAAPRRGERVQYQPVSRFQNSTVDVRRVLK